MRSLKITPQDDLRQTLHECCRYGITEVHLDGGTHVVSAPIFLDALAGLSIYNHNATIVREFGNTVEPLFYCPSPWLEFHGLNIDWNRQQWTSHSSLFGMIVPEWVATRHGYTGLRDCTHDGFLILGGHIYDSQNVGKPPGEGDNWVVSVEKSGIGSPHHNLNFAINGLRVSALNTELQGTTSGWENVSLCQNIITGGGTTGGLVSMLSRYNGRDAHCVRNVRICDNVLEHVNSFSISVGFDSDEPTNLIWDNLLISGNIIRLSERCGRYPRAVLLKLRNFTGTAVVRDNIYDLSRVSAGYNTQPRDLVAENDGTVGGTVLWSPSRVVGGEGIRVIQAVRSEQFAETVEITGRKAA